MPYIPPHQRRELDPLIDALAERIVHQCRNLEPEGAFAGLLNYACTRLALQIVRQSFGHLRYWLIALLTGTFKNIADEFYRRLAAPYEDKQKARHGDVDVYADFGKEIEGP